ncbi:UNVERIFIED_ORG: pyruvate/2-oxoglutarate dehydrogenase complex dihydrolipoamide acyltransferase (E2) component [Arthrobacter sp. UYEF2]
MPGTDSRTGLGISSRTPVKGVRKAVAANMSRSRSEIPEATVWVDVDATALVELRAGLKKSDPHTTPGLLAFIAFCHCWVKTIPGPEHPHRNGCRRRRSSWAAAPSR